ncbi:MAG: TetR/AcrR family transcriptional regulator [Planctomycetaceae bacterium]
MKTLTSTAKWNGSANGVRRREATETRRRSILDAALDCFLEYGVEGTTIDQIRQKSGASHGSIYHLFRGKDEIALTLFIEGMKDYHDRVVAAMSRETTARGLIRAMIQTHMTTTVDNPELGLYLTRMGLVDAIGSIREEYRHQTERFARDVWKHLQPFVERGELIQVDRSLYFSLIIGPSVHMARAWLRKTYTGDLLSVVDTLAEAAWKSLKTESGGS